MSERKAILLLGNYRPTLTLARTYARQGYRVVVTRGGGEGLTEFSRYVSGVWDEGGAGKDDRAFVAALADYLCGHPDIGTVVPVTERYAVAVAKHWDLLPRDRVFATPLPKLVLATLDKLNLFERVRMLNVPIAPFARVDDYDSLLRSLNTIGGPLVIRPLVSDVRLAGRKALSVTCPGELRDVLPVWPTEHAGLLVQRKVPGLRHNFYFAAQHGQLVRSLQTKILVTDHADGSGLATDGLTIATMPNIARYTRRIIASLGYHGVGCAQYLVDEATGGINFLEINPRIAGNHAVPEAAGLELGAVAVSLARNPALPIACKHGRTGQRYSWTYGAVRALKTAVASGQMQPRQIPSRLWQIARSAWRSDIHMTWSAADPLPTFALFATQLIPSGRRNRPAKTPATRKTVVQEAVPDV